MRCQTNVSECSFKSICLPKLVHTAADTNYQPVITMFDITPGIELVLNKIHLQESEIFIHLWEDFGREALKSATMLTLEDALTKVFKPAEAEWLNIRAKFLRGNLSFRDVDKHFGPERVEEDKLHQEFVLFNSGTVDDLVLETKKQVNRYWDLKLHVKSANAILDLKKALHLTKEFKEMELIISSEVVS